MTRLAATLSALLLTATPMLAQAPAAVLPPPTSGLLLSYSYWPIQYVQFVGPELPCSLITLEADTTGKQPVYVVTLTDRATGKRTHYTNTAALAAVYRARGEDAFEAPIAVTADIAETTGGVTTVRFSLADGRPVQWRFVQGSDITERGAGMTPLPELPMPVFAYREAAAVAGEGTALQIGNTVSTADVWQEISQPPYFVAYHGAISHSTHIVAFAPGTETWTVDAGPTSLTVGSTWELDSPTGNHRTLRIEKVAVHHITVSGTDRFSPSSRFMLDVDRETGTWVVNSIRYAPVHEGEKHSMTLQTSGNAENSTLTVIAGRKQVLASATITHTAVPTGQASIVTFTSPDWVRGRAVIETVLVTPSTVTTTAEVKSEFSTNAKLLQ